MSAANPYRVSTNSGMRSTTRRYHRPVGLKATTWATVRHERQAPGGAAGATSYLFVDPPFVRATPGEPVPAEPVCANPSRYGRESLAAGALRCERPCRATDACHRIRECTSSTSSPQRSSPGERTRRDSQRRPGLNGEPGATFVYVVPPDGGAATASGFPGMRIEEILCRPNPASVRNAGAMAPAANNGDPNPPPASKVEFHHLPAEHRQSDHLDAGGRPGVATLSFRPPVTRWNSGLGSRQPQRPGRSRAGVLPLYGRGRRRLRFKPRRRQAGSSSLRWNRLLYWRPANVRAPFERCAER
jgi:hypothetical protein